MREKTKNELKAVAAPYIEIVNQLGQTFLPPVWSAKEIMGAVYASQKKIHFQDFVEGIAYFFADESIEPKDAEILLKKVSDPSNYETMTGILDSVFFSHSKISRSILGVITGKFLCDNKLDYEDMVLSSALKDVFDGELNRFFMYCSYPQKSAEDKTSFVEHYTELDRLVVEKLQNVGILGRDLAGARLGNNLLCFELTTVAKRLKNYLDAIQPYFITTT